MEWISVEDRLPPLDRIVWLFRPKYGPFIGCRTDDGDGWLWANSYGSQYWHEGKWEGDAEIDDDYDVTHWMPLPDPPERV